MRRFAPILAILAALALAQPAQAAGLLVADGGFGGTLEIEEHTVEVTLNNGIAITEVNQVFRNTENRIVEALYTFPVPKGASVADFSMWIEGREMVGEVVEKERARRIYNSYKQQRRDPGLLEQIDYKTFEMRIFPIAARAEQRVRIVYYQELDFDNDWATYVYPLSTTTQTAIDSRTQGRFALNFEIASEVPVLRIESPSHADEFAVVRHTPHHARASLEVTGGDLSRDVVLACQLKRPKTGLDLVASMQPKEDGYFLITLTAGDELGEESSGMDYVFVLDISGSMNTDGKLNLSRRSLGAFIGELGAEDRFEVMTFNVAPNVLFGALRGADEPSKNEAEKFLGLQRPRGGTFLEPAIRNAYRYKDPDRPLNVVILSDGMTEQRERRTLLQLIGERPGSTRVFTIGVGNDVDRPLLRQLAEDAGGLAAFVSRGDDFERQARSFRRKLMRPAATNLEIEVAGGDVYDLEPRQLPNLYHGLPVRLYGRYRNPGPLVLTLRGDLGGESFERTLEMELPGEEADNPEIERMWAWHRVQRLLGEADRNGSRQSVIDEVVRLGEGYSIATEYTSFLVLENDAEYKRWKIDRRNALRFERDREKQARVKAELETLRRRVAKEIGPLSPGGSREQKAQSPSTSAASPSSSSRGWDLPLGGGGALDPLSAGAAALLCGIGALARRRRKQR